LTELVEGFFIWDFGSGAALGVVLSVSFSFAVGTFQVAISSSSIGVTPLAKIDRLLCLHRQEIKATPRIKRNPTTENTVLSAMTRV
jgi:hypothetical protein